jgi:hypothetical protein
MCCSAWESRYFLQRALRREEYIQTHLEGPTCLVHAEDWILGCLHESLRQICVLSIGPPPLARHDVGAQRMWRHWEENSFGGRLACRVLRTVGNALYLGAQGGNAWPALALQRAPISAPFSRARGTVGSSAPRKLFQKTKNGCGATIEFCGYSKVTDANPADLRL